MPLKVLSATLCRLVAAVALAASVVTTSAEPYLSEFMASNTASLRDDDQALSDWIELHNPDAVPVDLNGWYLTDSAANRTKWQFPAVTLGPGEYLVVFASNKDRRDPARPLHTSFALAVEGEYLALIKPDGVTVASEFAPEYPRQSADVSYGVVLSGSSGVTATYFSTPTPGAANVASGAVGLLDNVQFSRGSGPFAAAFTLELSGAGPGQHIRYVAVPPSPTGAVAPDPTETAAAYTGPLRIDAPVILRAAVFSDDLKVRGPSRSVQFFPVDLTGPLGLSGFSTQLPVLVIEQHGLRDLAKPDGERPAWLYGYSARPAGEPVFASQPNFAYAIRHEVRGSSSADFPKSSYNIEILNADGKKTKRPLFDAAQYDEWVLIGPWLYDPALIRNSYIYALSNSIGRWAPRTKPVEVFVNPHGTALDATAYFGVYALTEKIQVAREPARTPSPPADANSEPTPSNGYLLKVDVADEDEYSWTTRYLVEAVQTTASVVVTSPKADQLSDAQREYIRDYVERMEAALLADQASGWATRTYLDYIDRSSWVDHHILNTFAMNPDAFERSAYFTKDRGGKLVAGPVWDFDRALGSPVDSRSEAWNVWHGQNAVQVWYFGWWGLLATDPEFMQDWVDRWQALRREQFANENLTSLANQLAAAIGPEAAARDAARWPDNAEAGGGPAADLANLKQWLVARAHWIDEQFLAPPPVSFSGADLVLNPRPGAQIAYTLDGSDPRGLGGKVAPNAILSSTRVVVPASGNLQARSFNPDLQETFPGSPWSSAVGGPNSSPLAPRSRLVNLSSRAFVGSGENALIVGVVVADTAGKQYLARAIGPTLAAFGADGTVPDPQLSIFTNDGVEWYRNNGWQNGPNPAAVATYAQRVGAFPLAADSQDSALGVRLGTGAYTVQVTTPSGQNGVGLAELYELDANGRTVNLSTRATVGTGDGVLIGGFVVQGAAHKRMLVRAVGPTLAAFGVSEALMDPVLTIYSGSTVVASNEAWWSGQDAAKVNAASESVGAFPLASNSADAALFVTLPPGAYTVEVRSRGEAQGIALLEIYEVP